MTRSDRSPYDVPMTKLSIRMAVVLVWIAVSGSSLFGQDGLYAPSVPEDAALVRVANVHGMEESPRLDVGRERFAPLPARQVSAYRPVPPGIYILGGAGGVDFSPAPGRFYTIVADHGDVRAVVRDEAHTDPARAQLVLYNFSEAPAGLFAAPGDAIVFDNVPPGGSEVIAVNAIAVALSVRVDGDERMRRDLELERGESYGIFVGAEQVFVAPAVVTSE